MLILNPDDHTPNTIDADGTRRFEAFLDRNYPHWREHEFQRVKNAGLTVRSWSIGIDDIERTAIYRGDFVEIYDQLFNRADDGEMEVQYPKNMICAIDGDLTPVARWGQREPDRRWDDSLLPHYRTQIEKTYLNSIGQGWVDPVIVGYDVAHEYAYKLAVEEFGEEAVAPAMQHVRSGQPTVLFAVMNQEQAEKRLSRFSGYKHVAELQAQDMVAIVFFRDGNSEWVGMPKPDPNSPFLKED